MNLQFVENITVHCMFHFKTASQLRYKAENPLTDNQEYVLIMYNSIRYNKTDVKILNTPQTHILCSYHFHHRQSVATSRLYLLTRPLLSDLWSAVLDVADVVVTVVVVVVVVVEDAVVVAADPVVVEQHISYNYPNL